MLETLARPAPPAPAAAALGSYGRIALDARVAGASPHQLVAMLYQRLEALLREERTPRVLLEAMDNPDKAAAKRAFEAMMTMKKIDVARIEAALRGEAVNA